VQPGETVVVDFGALVDGYHSDMTRTFVVGEPAPIQQEVYDVVLGAQRAGVDAVRPGVTSAELDAVCRDHIEAAGLGPWFTHGTGHGVGLRIHEAPWITRSHDDVLAVGDVVTVEPGVYRGDFGGVRIEDLLVVLDDGCRCLTQTPKDSPCLPSRRTT
jgi:Xaa-Pro aminopeptidase